MNMRYWIKAGVGMYIGTELGKIILNVIDGVWTHVYKKGSKIVKGVVNEVKYQLRDDV